MRVDSATDVEFAALPAVGSECVKIQIGGHGFTATEDDAAELARQLIEAVHELQTRAGADRG